MAHGKDHVSIVCILLGQEGHQTMVAFHIKVIVSQKVVVFDSSSCWFFFCIAICVITVDLGHLKRVQVVFIFRFFANIVAISIVIFVILTLICFFSVSRLITRFFRRFFFVFLSLLCSFFLPLFPLFLSALFFSFLIFTPLALHLFGSQWDIS